MKSSLFDQFRRGFGWQAKSSSTTLDNNANEPLHLIKWDCGPFVCIIKAPNCPLTRPQIAPQGQYLMQVSLG